ncbi:MAG: metalloprotease family protein [Bacillota bacterium]
MASKIITDKDRISKIVNFFMFAVCLSLILSIIFRYFETIIIYIFTKGEFPQKLMLVTFYVVGYYFLRIIHESIHFLIAKHFHIKSKIKFMKTSGLTYFKKGTEFSLFNFSVIILSPFTFLLLLLIINYLFYNGPLLSPLLELLLIHKLEGCKSDISMFLQAIKKVDKNERIYYLQDGEFEIRKPSCA